MMKKVSVLPSLITLGNLLCGFGSIVQAAQSHYVSASWLIFLAMVFDALDGKIARMAKLTSDFGAELDSLCDMVTFGLAPAFLVAQIGRGVLPDKFVWLVGALYVTCAGLRLARYNVENVHEDAAHDYFKGLPSPAAAGQAAALIILLRSTELDTKVLARLLPVFGLILGALMVSRFKYVHVLNKVLKGQRPFAYLVELIFLGVFLAWQLELTLACGFFIYMVSGPALYVRELLTGRLRDEEEEPVF